MRWLNLVKKLFTQGVRRSARPVALQARPSLEQLESRVLLSLVSWDGGAGTLSWRDAPNWSGDALPGSGDAPCTASGASSLSSLEGLGPGFAKVSGN